MYCRINVVMHRSRVSPDHMHYEIVNCITKSPKMDTNYQTHLSSKKEVDAILELIMDSDNGDTPADDGLDASEDVSATPAPLK